MAGDISQRTRLSNGRVAPDAPVIRSCEQCLVSFATHASEVRRGHARFCSKPCAFLFRKRTLIDRFWDKVDKNGPIPSHYPDLGNCYLWTGSMNNAGYGQIQSGDRGGGLLLTSHVAFELEYGRPLAPGMWALHRRDNPPCIRGTHFFEGTYADNMRDMVAKGRQNNGHRKS